MLIGGAVILFADGLDNFYDEIFLILDMLVLGFESQQYLASQVVLVIEVGDDVGDLLLTFNICLIVIFGGKAIFGGLTVLGHHDERS